MEQRLTTSPEAKPANRRSRRIRGWVAGAAIGLLLFLVYRLWFAAWLPLHLPDARLRPVYLIGLSLLLILWYYLRVLRRLATAVIVVLIFLFLGRTLYDNWQKIPFDTLKFRPTWFVASYVLLLVCFYLGVLGWKLILDKLGSKVSFPAATNVYATSQFGKYMPGKIWFAVGRMELARREGVPEKTTGISVVLESAFLSIASVMLFLVSLLFYPTTLTALKYVVVVLLPFGLTMLYPPLFNRVLNFLLVRFKRQPVKLAMTFGDVLLVLLLYAVLWVGQTLAMYLLVLSFYNAELSLLPVLIGGYAISWMAGFLVLLAPGGLGVRDGMLYVMLRGYFQEPRPVPMAALIPVVSRLWITVGEVLFLALSAVWVRIWRRNVKKQATGNQKT